MPIGQTVQVGTPLARLAGTGRDRRTAHRDAACGDRLPPQSTEQPPSSKPPPVVASGSRPSRRRLSSTGVAGSRPRPVGSRLSLGVDVENVTGTGPQGAVTINDVEHAAAHIEAAAPEAPKTVCSTNRRSAVTEGACRQARRRDAQVHRGGDEPVEAGDSALLPRRRDPDGPGADLARRPQRDSAPSPSECCPPCCRLKAVALAAQRFGEFSGFWRDDGFEPAPKVHVGVAISLRGGGLVAPAIHDVADKNLDELMGDLTDLVARARAFSLRSSEMSDPTITVTNLGDQGVDAVFGVIYPPQVALVGFGKPAPRVRRDRRRHPDRHHGAGHPGGRSPSQRRTSRRAVPRRDQRTAPTARPAGEVTVP